VVKQLELRVVNFLIDQACQNNEITRKHFFNGSGCKDEFVLLARTEVAKQIYEETDLPIIVIGRLVGTKNARAGRDIFKWLKNGVGEGA
jgi:hypothetical protein